MQMIRLAEIMWAIYMVVGILLLVAGVQGIIAFCLFEFQITLLTIILWWALKRLRKLNEKVTFIICNEKLMNAHQIAFIVAASFGWIVTIL